MSRRRLFHSAVCLNLSFLLPLFCPFNAMGQSVRTLSGIVVTQQFELVPNTTVVVETAAARFETTTDGEGAFSIPIPPGLVIVKIEGRNISPFERTFSASERTDGIELKIAYLIPPVAASVTIEGDALAPDVERRNDTIYKSSLFNRDDQLIFTLNAGINAGQHEGGGKSLEIRRFGYNLDHGGVNGGLKIVVDNLQQNQETQGHGQGYLGNLKSLSPELVEDVSIINGPFSAAYGDFSALGVVQIRLKESLPHRFTARIQGGSFNTVRGFFSYSPSWKNIDGFVSYEPSYTDGPFINKGRYRRDNVSGNITYKLGVVQSLGVKLNLGSNNFFSSGQIPLDEVNAGRLDRFGFIDPENGGRVQLGSVAPYYRKGWKSEATLKADLFVGRSLFDLFSNFTFFLTDPIYGDEIQQHDSRLQEGGNIQFLQPYKLGSIQSLLTVGGGVHLNQINVALYPSIGRAPRRKFLPANIDNPSVLYTKAHAKVNNYSAYLQNSFAFFDGHLRLEAGLRFDYFSFDVSGFELGGLRDGGGTGICNSSFADPVNPANPCAVILNGKESSGKFQPKLSAALSPFEKVPVSFYVNYGRGISSQDARGVVRNPDAPKISTTDFYQAGTAYNGNRGSLLISSFFIDRSNEQVYIPDDGTIEFAGRSRSYGIEVRNSIRFTKFLSFNAGLTQVIRAYYPGQFTVDGRRVVVDSASHTVANGSIVLSELKGFNAALNYRTISGYRLDGEDPTIKAAGQDVVDFSLTKHLKKWVDLNFSIDNLLNKKYFETQNFFESRLLTDTSVGIDPGSGRNVYPSRIHATPGYPFAVSAGLTFRFGVKN